MGEPWYGRGRDLARRWWRDLTGGQRSRQNPRWIAYEVTVRATSLNGEAAPSGLEAMNIEAMLTHARRALEDMSVRQDVEDASARKARLEVDRLREANAELRALVPEDRRPGGTANEPPPLVPELIDMADRIAGLRDRLDPPVARWLLERVSGMLADLGVRDIHEDGEVDPGRHDVQAVRRTDDPRLIGRIAETVRPGYVWRDRILRPQQVVAYVGEGSER